TRSMSRWSMIATSPGSRRLVRRFVIRSSRAGPVKELSATLGSLDHLGSANRRQEILAAEHAFQLALALGTFECLDSRVRRVAGDLLAGEVPVAQARDLGQVRDRDHLRALRGTGERAADGVRGLAADPRVELVEHERVAAGDDGDRERDPRELAA